MKQTKSLYFIFLLTLFGLLACGSTSGETPTSPSTSEEENQKLPSGEDPRDRIKLCTFNLRYDNPRDGINSWKGRREKVFKFLRSEAPDILGTQEGLAHMIDDLKNALSGYACVGVGREDGKRRGEYSAIFYNKTKYTLLESGHFWLSETRDKPSQGWDAACERIATWALLKEVGRDQKVFVLNTHFDHEGKEARLQSARMILERAGAVCRCVPLLVMGDFNATIDTPAMQILLDPSVAGTLRDARDLSKKAEGPRWSFHDFGRIPFDSRPLIDHIFLRGPLQVDSYKVVTEHETDNHVYLSDHAPILVQLTRKKPSL